jgi:filamentous hemagglutinin family protein
MNFRSAISVSTSLLGLFVSTAIAQAQQVVPDGSLKTIVNSSNGRDFIITGGGNSETNLFHSFSEFSIPTGGSAFFNNAATVQNIFSRVTGNNVSNIDGLVTTNGTANLFLLNPNGVVFGPRASLNIGGSFLGTTANSIKFADGAEFSATNPAPLLTMSVPIGLQMGQNPALIQVQGQGHTLSISDPTLPLLDPVQPAQLQVQPGKTLAFVGGDLSLAGATLAAPSGRIELVSLASSGLIKLTPLTATDQWEPAVGQTQGKIHLTQQSLLDTTGLGSGSIRLQGRQIQLMDGSLLLSQNYGDLPGGLIQVQASEAISFSGRTPDTAIWSGIRSNAFGAAPSSSIQLIAPQLEMQQGAAVNSATFSAATSGGIQVKADTIQLAGASLLNPTALTNLTTATYASGSAGDISVHSDRLWVSNGASLSSVSFSEGSSGKVTIRTRQTTLSGESPFGLYSSISLTSFATGSSKELILTTEQLNILEGATVGSSALFIGNAGDVTVNSSESVTIDGQNRNGNSGITSYVIRFPQLRQLFGLPDLMSANAGTVNVTTPSLTLTNGGTVSVTNEGSGNGGGLRITANQLILKNQGLVQAQTASGNGGNIDLKIGDLLLMRQGSQIASTAAGNGDGGNIKIQSSLVMGLENSDISTNAIRGDGGNIKLTTQALLGIKPRLRLTPESDITASSAFGLSGSLQVNSITVDPSSGLLELPVDIVDPTQQVAQTCDLNQASSFVVTGRGGVPGDPMGIVNADRTWSDFRPIVGFNAATPVLKLDVQVFQRPIE